MVITELKPVISGLVSLVLCAAIMPLVIKLARYKGWVVKPRSDRWHKQPTALMGGIGIFLAFNITYLLTDWWDLNWMIYGAFALMFVVGLLDDLYELKPVHKLIAQLLCSVALIYHGYNFGGGLLGWFGIPLTFFWVIGITNAINLLDNMDGLASGISGIVAIICGILAIINGYAWLATMAFALAGAAIGFLFYNFKPAKIFMGDSGSMFLGFTLSFLSISVQGKLGSSSALAILLVPITLMAIPIMDSTLVSVKRTLAGRRIDTGGRDHTSHRLVALGLSEKKAVLTLYVTCAVWGVLCILIYKSQINKLLLCVALFAIFSIIFSVILSKVKVYNESEEKLTYLRIRGQGTGDGFMFRFLLLNKKLFAGVFADIMIIYCSYFIAENSLSINVGNDYVVLATFICVKVSVFYLCRLYYRMWSYMELVEIASYFMTILLATLILMGITAYKGKTSEYQPYFFLLDFLLTFTGMVFSRLFYRWVNDQINRNRVAEKRALIYGAGDCGCMLVREILQNRGHGLSPVGWIDDDVAKHNMLLYGYKIYGGQDQLKKICKKVKPDIIIISTATVDETHEVALKKLLEEENIQLGRFNLSFQYN